MRNSPRAAQTHAKSAGQTHFSNTLWAGIWRLAYAEVFIVTGFRADVIEAHFSDGKKWGARIGLGRSGGGRTARAKLRNQQGHSWEQMTSFSLGRILVRPETYPQMLRRFKEGAFAGATVTGSQDVTNKGESIFSMSRFASLASWKNLPPRS